MCKLSKAWDFYRKTTLNLLSDKSIKTEEARWKRIEKYFEDCHLKTITTLKVIEFKKHLFSSKLSPQSVRHCLSLLQRTIHKSQILDLYKGKIPYFEMPKFDNKRSRFLSHDEAMQLLETLKNKSILWHDITYLALMTGLRAGEIFNIKPSNCDFNNNLLHIVDSKTKSNRIIPIKKDLKDILYKYYQEKREYIFMNRNNEKYTAVSKLFTRTVRANNLNQKNDDRRDKVVFHTLRHTFASWLIQKDVPLMVVGQLLGHSNIQMTMRYAHLGPNQGRSAIELISF